MKTHLVFLSLIIVISSCKKNPNEIFEKSIKKVSNIEIIEQRVAINYQDFLNHFWHTDTVYNYLFSEKIIYMAAGITLMKRIDRLILKCL